MGNCNGGGSGGSGLSANEIVKSKTKAPKGEDYDYLYKILLIGDSGVGKSALLLRFSEDTFTDSFISTIGVDFKIRTVEVGGKRLKLQLWDTAGQERFRTITSSYYRGAQGIMVVYDITNAESFKNCSKWIGELQKFAGNEVVMSIIGNKCDLEEEREVALEEAEAFAKTQGDVSVIETSAKANQNVQKIFLDLAKVGST